MNSTKKAIAAITLTTLLFTSTSMHFDFKNQFVYGVRYPKHYTEESFENQSYHFEDTFNRVFQNTNFVPQGLTFDDQYIYVSFYEYHGEFNSVILTMDNYGHFINICTLKNNAHVGGISYDKNNDLIWVASKNGMVDAYKKASIVNDATGRTYYQDLYLGEGLPNYVNPFSTAVSFLTVKDNELFVGNFSLFNKGRIKRYSISVDPDKTVRLKLQGTSEIPNKVQGISFYEKEGQDYLLLSRSFGKKDNSILQIYKYNPEIKDYTKEESTSYEFPEMVEETFVKDDYLYSLYESNANPYENTNEKNKTLRISRMDTLF